MSEMLDIVNEHDEVIGTLERSEVSKRGLGCRIVAVLFYRPNGEVILQRRHHTKSMPGKLTTTVSGHVESGKTYDETAVKETKEETGVRLEIDQFTNLGALYYDSTNGMRWAGIYLHEYHGDLERLVVEENEGAGFVSVPLDTLERAVTEEPSEYTPLVTSGFGKLLLSEVSKRVSLAPEQLP